MGEASEPEVDFTKLPIDERCQHKNWKARVSGYESLAQLFALADDDKGPEFSKYVSIIRKFPLDSNAAAQEKGLAAVSVFVENASPSISSRIAGEVLTGIISKCLISPKARTKELASDIVLMYIEVERHEVVMEELLKGTDNKSPKIVSCCISLLKESLRLFGPKVIRPTPLIKMIMKGLENRDKIVRDASKEMTVEIYRWMKDAFKPQLAGLNPVQLSELETEFEKIASEKAQPVRYLRSEQARVHTEVVTAGDTGDGQALAAPEPSEDIDPYELLEPVEILAKLPSDFYTNVESKKWQERKGAIESLQDLLTPNPKLASGDYGDLVKVLKIMIKKDTNIPVVAAAAKAMADLAFRLRKSFHPYAHSTVAIIFDKFKEKKTNVVTALREAIDAVMLSTNLELVLEDVQGALQNKNPQIKAETASFLTRQFSGTSYTVLGEKKLLKTIVNALILTLNDMDAAVRDAAAEAIGTVQKVVGEKAMAALLADVDPIKLTKIKEFHDKAVVKYTAPAGGFKGGAAVIRPETAAAGRATIASKPGARSASVGELAVPAKVKKSPPIKPVNKPVIAKPRTDSGLRKTKVSTSAPTLEKQPSTSVATPANRRMSGQGLVKVDAVEEASAAVPVSTNASRTVTRPGAAAARKGGALPKFVPKGAVGKKETLPVEQHHAGPIRGQSHDLSEDEEEEEEAMSEASSDGGGGKTYNVRNGGGGGGGGNNNHHNARTVTGAKTIQVQSPPKVDVALSMTMNQLMAQDADDVIEAFSQLKQLFNKPDRAETLLGSKVDQIILMCNMQYRMCTNKLADDRTPKSSVIDVLKSVTSVLDSLFKHPTLKKRATRDVLRDLMPHIISIILDPKLGESEEGKVVSRSVNVLATCIIVSADPTNMMRALIKLLHDCVGGSNSHSNKRTIEMIMKCIWKMLRFVPQFIDQLDIDSILLDVHLFMMEYPSEYWKRVASENDPNKSDTPLRTVKTIVYFLVEEKLDDVLNHLTQIPDQSSSELVGYIGRAMKQVKKKNESIKPLASSGPYNLSDRDTAQLTAIFAKLGSLNPQEGFLELHRFLVTRPEFNIEKHLESSTSDYFNKFVMEGLAKISVPAVARASVHSPMTFNHSPMKEDMLPPPPIRLTTNGTSPAISVNSNGKSPMNGNGSSSLSPMSSTHSVSPVKSQTPEPLRSINRPKLGRLSGNTGIPTPSAIPVAGFRFGRLPPPDQMSPGDVIDFIKCSHQSLGVDSSKVDVSSIQRRVAELNSQVTGTPTERLKKMESMAEETRFKMINFKAKYSNSDQS